MKYFKVVKMKRNTMFGEMFAIIMYKSGESNPRRIL